LRESCPRPTDSQVQGFLERLRSFRDTLPDSEQRLLNAMYFAAMGRQLVKDQNVAAFWFYCAPYGEQMWGGPWVAAWEARVPGPASASHPFLYSGR
jgi:hypothetical protein